MQIFYLLKNFLDRNGEIIGDCLAMTYKAILSTSHLQYAARQSKLLAVAWRDMEYLISAHKPQNLFVGGSPMDQSPRIAPLIEDQVGFR